MKIKYLLTAIMLTQLPSVQAETIDVDWLYMSTSGTWLERNETLTETETALALPIENLSSDFFWWQGSDAQTRVTWQSPYAKGWPKAGDVVTSEQLDGEWIIDKVQSQHLVLTQDTNRRFWPTAQMHLLQWTQTEPDSAFELMVEQPSKGKNKFQYAWLDGLISANVSYRLSLSGDPVLHQSLIISNNSQYDLSADGYSYAMSQQQSFPVMYDLASRSQMEVASPKASQSEGIPTLVSSSPVRLNAQANLWLPVSSTSLSSVEKQYSLAWDTRMQGLQQASSAIKIKSKATLPDIPGAITLGVFDQQVATLNSQYQPSTEHEAILNLGQTSLLTLTAKVVGENEWSLTVTNRSDDDAKLDLVITHWNGKVSEKIPMPIQIKANDTKTLDVQLGQGGKVVLEK